MFNHKDGEKPMKRNTVIIVLTILFICLTYLPVFASQQNDESNQEDIQVFQDHQYLVILPPSFQRETESYSWMEAKEWCERNGGHLVTPNSLEEYEFLYTLIKNIPEHKEEINQMGEYPINGFWIGIYSTPDAKTRSFVTEEEFRPDIFGMDPGYWGTNKYYMYSAIKPGGGNNTIMAGEDDEWCGENLGYGFICEWDNNDLISINKAEILIKEEQYTGEAIIPEITVTYKGESLKQGEDYTIKYDEIIDAGNATIEVSGKGRFKDTVEKIIQIKPLDISECTVELPDGDSYGYTGKPVRPPVLVKYKDKTIPYLPDKTFDINDTSSKNIEAGKGYIIIEGKGNIVGREKKNIKIYSLVDPDEIERVVKENSLSEADNAYKALLSINSKYGERLMEDRNGINIFLFEGTGNDSSSSMRMNAMCVVAKEGKIIFFNRNCTTIPDYPFTPSKNGGTDMPTIKDGIYRFTTVNHRGSYAALNILGANVLRFSSNTEYYDDKSSAINVHQRSTDSNSPVNKSWANSSGCQLIGKKTEYASFIKSIGIVDSATVKKYTTSKTGNIIIDRTYAYGYMLNIGYPEEAIKVIR